MTCRPQKAELIVHACCCLHNLLIQERPQPYLANVQRVPVAPGIYDVDWHEQDVLLALRKDGRRRPNTKFHYAVRNHLKEYFANTGKIPWQDRMTDLQTQRNARQQQQ